MPEVDLFFAAGLKPEKAIEYFKSKDFVPSWDWHEVWQEAHAKAFTVAKAMRMDVLTDIRGMVDNSLDEGLTFQQFKKELEPNLKNKGWWGKKMVGDETRGRVVQLGSLWRLKNIYRTNLQTAYMTGRHREFMENVDNRPYWQYVAILDAATRPAHADLHGLVFSHDDPFWNSFDPPIDWGCRCRKRALSKSNIAKRKLTVQSGHGKIRTHKKIVSQKTGRKADIASYTNPRTGRTVQTGPGWNYSPGKAWQPDLDTYSYDLAHKYLAGAIRGPHFKRFFEGKAAGEFPVAVMDEAYRKAIKAKSQIVSLSSDTLAKNKLSHPEILISDYRKLPEIIEQAQLIVKDRDRTFVFLRREEKIYYGSIKTTKTGETNYLTSLRLARKSDISRIRKKGQVLKDEL